MKEKINDKLDTTGKNIPAGLMMGKVIPSKRTCRMHAVIPVPENALSHLGLNNVPQENKENRI